MYSAVGNGSPAQVFLCGDNTRQFPIDVMKTLRRPVRSMLNTGWGSGPSKQTIRSKCGKSPNYDIEVCPAKDAICRVCGREHFQQVCRSNKKISSINETPEQIIKSFFLGVVSGSKELWSVTLHLNGRSIFFCLNTGAEVTVILEKIYTKIGSPDLKTFYKTLVHASFRIREDEVCSGCTVSWQLPTMNQNWNMRINEHKKCWQCTQEVANSEQQYCRTIPIW